MGTAIASILSAMTPGLEENISSHMPIAMPSHTPIHGISMEYPCHSNTFGSLCYRIQMYMTWYYFTLGIYNTYKGSVQFLINITHGLEKRAMRPFQNLSLPYYFSFLISSKTIYKIARTFFSIGSCLYFLIVHLVRIAFLHPF